MTIFRKLLRLLSQTGDSTTDVEPESARNKRTEQVIERYDEMLNANPVRRHRRSSTASPRESGG
jgi:hypothetical protein